MRADPPADAVPLTDVLRRLPVQTRIRLILRLLRGQRDFVVMGDLPGLPPDRSPTPTMRPGVVRFQPEFSCEWPLWSKGESGGTPQRELMPLPDDLKHRIDDWAARWNRVMYDNFYEWPDDAIRAAFDEEARQLCDEMAEALGPPWRIEYGGVDA